jgi:hypothetical protein
MSIKAPVAIIIEAKREDLNAAIPQCVAAMVAAQIFNQRHQKSISTIYGSVTTGSVWRFLQLTGNQAVIDLNEVYLTPLETLFGYLAALLAIDQLVSV